MAKTVQDALLEARRLLQDLDSPYRYPEADLIAAFNSLMYELKRVRPDAWLGKLGTDLPEYTVSDLSSPITLPFPMVYFQPVVYYLVGYMELRDDEFVSDARAVALMAAFTQQLSTPSSVRGT